MGINQVWRFQDVLGSEGWMGPTNISINEAGLIVQIGGTVETIDRDINGFLLPGFQNAHSHSFQYAMAGLTENLEEGKEEDDFWSWRKSMYQLALSLEPNELEIIATQLYSEMVKNGITHVCEFHYLHHDKEGRPYQNKAEMGERLVAAAEKVGIGITLVPIYYNRGGFNKNPLEEQRRFISQNPEDYFELLNASLEVCQNYQRAKLGFGVHSLRACTPGDLKIILKETPIKGPFHLHIAEQINEIKESEEVLKKPPVQWLLDEVDINQNFHLVHATHLNKEEIKGIAQTGAHVVICPSTEGNLGDGFFSLNEFLKAGGSFSIGSDSHIGLNPCEELRWLDYGQRLQMKKRNPLLDKGGSDSGDLLWRKSYIGGLAARGLTDSSYFSEGSELTGIVLDGEHPLLAQTNQERYLSSYIFSGGADYHLGVLVAGNWTDPISPKEFSDGMKSLKTRL